MYHSARAFVMAFWKVSNAPHPAKTDRDVGAVKSNVPFSSQEAFRFIAAEIIKPPLQRLCTLAPIPRSVPGIPSSRYRDMDVDVVVRPRARLYDDDRCGDDCDDAPF